MTKPWRNITTIWSDKKNCVFVFISVNLTGGSTLGLQKKLEALPQTKENAVYDAESSDRDVKGTSYGNAKEELKEAPKGFWRRLFGQ